MKRFIVSAIISLAATQVSAQQFQFDSNGGDCDVGVYAQFGYEGMVYVDLGGSRYIPEGEFYFTENVRSTKDGIYVYSVGDKWGNEFKFYVLPTGQFTASDSYDKKSMKQEGNVDVAKLVPCK